MDQNHNHNHNQNYRNYESCLDYYLNMRNIMKTIDKYDLTIQKYMDNLYDNMIKEFNKLDPITRRYIFLPERYIFVEIDLILTEDEIKTVLSSAERKVYSIYLERAAAIEKKIKDEGLYLLSVLLTGQPQLIIIVDGTEDETGYGCCISETQKQVKSLRKLAKKEGWNPEIHYDNSIN